MVVPSLAIIMACQNPWMNSPPFLTPDLPENFGMILSSVVWHALLVSLAPAPAFSAAGSEPVTLTGRAVELAAALKPLGVAFDPEPVAKQVVVQGPDGAITPLISDEASRALFLDERLRDRPLEIQGRRFPGIPYVQVTSIRVDEQGQLRTPEYSCEICAISVRYPQTCPCCQGPMVLRMRPAER